MSEARSEKKVIDNPPTLEATPAACLALEARLAQVEADLARSERRLQQAQAMARIGNWELDLRQNHLWWSDEIFRIFELDPRRFAASYEAFLKAVHPDDLERVNAAYTASVASRSPYQIVHRLLMPDGRIKYVQETCETDYDAQGNALLSRGTVLDVTAAAKTEISLLQSLREKETLLREVHHRVKNNLQIISGLLHFQAQRVRDPTDAATFDDGRERLRSMILVHEKLYQSHDLSRVDFGDYVRSLVSDLRRSQCNNDPRIAVRIEAESCQLPIEFALPCGMILCELLTNAFKYAFPRGRTGTIVTRTLRRGDRMHLEVSDDGIGLPATVDLANPASFGWQLVCNLVTQLDGRLEPRVPGTGAGTSIMVSFPQPSPPPEP